MNTLQLKKQLVNQDHWPIQWRALATITVTTAWLAMIGTGLCWMWEYELTPAQASTAVTSWPEDSQLELNRKVPTLLVFAHPHCSCTRATIGELEKIVTRHQGQVDAQVLFFKPEEFETDWEKTDIWNAAESIQGVKVICDQSGSEARSFCANTSGYSLLYDSDGRLIFSGGITGSRGHAGDNAGRCTVERILNGETIQRRTAFVFGCPLFESEFDSVNGSGRSK